MELTFFHRNIKAGYSINKVSKTYIDRIKEKEEFYMPRADASPFALLTNLLFTFRHRNKLGINHITGDIHYCILALLGVKSVLTIHDTVALDYAEGTKLKKYIQEWLWFRLPIKFATKVVCISEETKRLILPYTNRKDILVIHNAVDPVFKTIQRREEEFDNRILFIGTRINKNLERFVKALHGIDCHLTIIGHLSQSQVDILVNNQIDYDVKSDLKDEEIVEEYVKTDIIAFPSLFEGFGMPVIEGNKVGRPVLCSNIPVLKEVAGDSAVFVNPWDVNDIRKGVKALFASPDLRKQCIMKGFENVKRFDVNVISKQYVSVYNKLLGNK